MFDELDKLKKKEIPMIQDAFPLKKENSQLKLIIGRVIRKVLLSKFFKTFYFTSLGLTKQEAKNYL
jgi:hypothetical protein